jgi:hypothetical protein
MPPRGSTGTDERAASAEPAPPSRRTNRVFWGFLAAMTIGGAVLTFLVFVNRPILKVGAARVVEDGLVDVAAVARSVADEAGSLAAADRYRLNALGGDVLFIDPDQASNDPDIVSVYAMEDRWIGSARAETGGCYWIRLLPGGSEERGTGTDCSAEEAAFATAGGWPEDDRS